MQKSDKKPPQHAQTRSALICLYQPHEAGQPVLVKARPCYTIAAQLQNRHDLSNMALSRKLDTESRQVSQKARAKAAAVEATTHVYVSRQAGPNPCNPTELTIAALYFE